MGFMDMLEAMDDTRARVGRPPSSELPRERARHLKVAYRMAEGQKPVAAIAAQHRVSRSTCYRWRDQALTYDEAEVLRDAIAKRQAGDESSP